jgi:CBS domain-containing protein
MPISPRLAPAGGLRRDGRVSSSVIGDGVKAQEGGDFTANVRLVQIAAIAVGVGMLCATVAFVLLKMIALFTKLFYYQSFSFEERSPAGNTLGWLAAPVPIVGGLAVGIGGMIRPHALGVGYDIIADLLRGHYEPSRLPGLIVVKGLIWAIALGSGTSGGVLAPLLIMGGALGAIAAPWLPGADLALWPLVSMAAALGGTMRCPLTSIVFALELTHDIHALPALLVASTVSYGFTVLVMRRSILTEKVARRGYHITREYSVDPLERLGVGEVMTTDVVTIPAALPIRELIREYFFGGGSRKHPAYPVVDKAGRLVGMVMQSSLLDHWTSSLFDGAAGADPLGLGPIIAFDLIDHSPITIEVGATCRDAAMRMAESSVKQLPVVSPDAPDRIAGIVTLGDLLKSRQRLIEEEDRRERFLGRGAPPA